MFGAVLVFENIKWQDNVHTSKGSVHDRKARIDFFSK